jgi:hypothetical protein
MGGCGKIPAGCHGFHWIIAVSFGQILRLSLKCLLRRREGPLTTGGAYIWRILHQYFYSRGHHSETQKQTDFSYWVLTLSSSIMTQYAKPASFPKSLESPSSASFVRTCTVSLVNLHIPHARILPSSPRGVTPELSWNKTDTIANSNALDLLQYCF